MPKPYANRYAKPRAALSSGHPHTKHPKEESVQEFIAYLYSVIRHDDALVHLIDRALKDRYGDNQPHH